METEVGLGAEWLSKSSGSLGVIRSLRAGHSPCPGCACLPVRLWPRGHISQAWLAEGRAPYGCL